MQHQTRHIHTHAPTNTYTRVPLQYTQGLLCQTRLHAHTGSLSDIHAHTWSADVAAASVELAAVDARRVWICACASASYPVVEDEGVSAWERLGETGMACALVHV